VSSLGEIFPVEEVFPVNPDQRHAREARKIEKLKYIPYWFFFFHCDFVNPIMKILSTWLGIRGFFRLVEFVFEIELYILMAFSAVS
jgi:hypothetical protein